MANVQTFEKVTTRVPYTHMHASVHTTHAHTRIWTRVYNTTVQNEHAYTHTHLLLRE